jgi:hypothetical protein
MIAMLSLCSSFTVLCYVLSYKGSDSLLLCGSSGISRAAPPGSRGSPQQNTQRTNPRFNLWAGATATVPVATKWGRSRPLRCITRVQTARRAMCNLYAPNNFVSPLGDVNGDGDGYVCLSRTRHLSAPGKASKPLPRISIRNGFTRPTRHINANSPLFTKRPSREEILTENLCDLPFSFRGPATRRLTPAVGVRHGCADELPTLQTAIEAL